MIPNTGNLAETAPIKLLLAMDEQSQTGILYFRKNDILKVFYLNQGKISWAISSDEEDKIEHVLLAKKLVSPEALTPFLAGNKIGESFGKVLVENGLISLETLINASREQLKRIATSVMFWNSGNYQLEPESPPTRLVSLELEIVPLVYNYVQAHMDVNIIWEEIGSLSGELRQVPEPEKIFQYSLDAEQQEVFAYFREPQRPENVLLRFPAERKHAVLKVLYFLLITGLLVKKEADAIPALDFNELDSLFGQGQAETQAKEDVDIPAMINEADIKDIPQLDLPEISEPQAITEVTLPEPLEASPQVAAKPFARTGETSRPAMADKKTIPIRPLLQEKPKSRWLSVSFLSIALTLIVIALFFWFYRAPGAKEPEPAPRRPAPRTRRESPKPRPAALAEPKAGPENTALPSSGPPAADPAPPVAEKKEAAQAKPPATGSADARQAFASGEFSVAGDLWAREMVSDKIAFSVLLEMDCLKESVDSAYQQVTDRENFFILNRVKNGRTCWLVLWGKFRTRDEAAQNLNLVPAYFFKQSEPPLVIDLEPYL